MTRQLIFVSAHRRLASQVFGLLLAFALLSFSVGLGAQTLSPELVELLQADNVAQAIPQLESLAAARPRDAEVRYQLARAYWSNGQDKAAEEAVEALLELRQDEATDYYLAGRIYVDRLQSVGIFKKLSYARKLRKAFTTSMELDPTFIKARLAMVRFHLAAPGVVGGSREAAETIVANLKSIDTLEGLRAEAMMALADEDIDGALALLRKILEQRPDDVNALFSQAAILISREDFDQAMPVLRRALAVPLSADMDVRQQQRSTLYLVGKAASEIGQWLDEGRMALENYVKAPNLHHVPARAWAYYRLGLIHEHLDEPETADQYFMLARQENQDDDRLDDELKAQAKKRRFG